MADTENKLTLALRILRKFIEGEAVTDDEIFDAFPGLRESEDERIRKEMIGFLKSEKAFRTIDLHTSERWVAYLEKQKEQKQNQLEDYSRGYNDGYYHGITDSEQKPASSPIMTEKRLNLEKSINVKEYVYGKTDEEFIRGCANILIANDFAISAERLLSMFPSKPAEWSKEDETRCTNAIILLQTPILRNVYRQDEIEKAVGWLRDLRPQPHWKPSEEQMKALKRTILLANFGAEKERQDAMSSLYTDLLKLNQNSITCSIGKSDDTTTQIKSSDNIFRTKH